MVESLAIKCLRSVAKQITNFDKSNIDLLEKQYKCIYAELKEKRMGYNDSTVSAFDRNFDFWTQIYHRCGAELNLLFQLLDAVLVTQVNSACNERTFSIRKAIMGDKRSSLLPQTVENIVRIHQNSCALNCDDCPLFYKECVNEFSKLQ